MLLIYQIVRIRRKISFLIDIRFVVVHSCVTVLLIIEGTTATIFNWTSNGPK